LFPSGGQRVRNDHFEVLRIINVFSIVLASYATENGARCHGCLRAVMDIVETPRLVLRLDKLSRMVDDEWVVVKQPTLLTCANNYDIFSHYCFSVMNFLH
jgi:hypothetical protein